MKNIQLKYNRVGKTIFCSQCNRKFQSTGKFMKHIYAKHSQSIFGKATPELKPLPDRLTCSKKEQFKTVQHINNNKQMNNSVNSLFESFNCAEIFQVPTVNNTNLEAEHVQYAIKESNDHIETFSCWQCTREFQSADVRAGHFFRKRPTNFRSKILELSADLKKSFRCWQSIKQRFRSEKSFLSHFISKHITFILSTNTDPSSLLDSQLTLLQELIPSIDRSQYSERLELQCQVNEEEEKTDEFVSISKSPLSDYCHEGSDSTTTQSNSIFTAGITQHPSDLTSMFSCWQCSKKFKTDVDRLKHFIYCHFLSIVSISNIRSGYTDNSTDRILNGAAVSNTSITKQFRCSSCTQKFQSDQRFLFHFVDKHANFILSANTDPTDYLNTEIIKAKQQIIISSKHVESSSSNTTLMTNHICFESVSGQGQKQTTEHLIETSNAQPHLTTHVETFKSTTCPNDDFDEKNVEFSLTTNAQSFNSFSNQLTITKSQNDAADHEHSSSKIFSC
ncbi:unnamed protein product [Didymodactylos carnosus]|uniref:C2H2-type domain-containing protein n=1 Tax=Didymodactylos carnosus TaxID=1234261 RepID=A0A8S2QSZ5_9BILA|nr:unnamed protein product [Didymodactylos carnosus]CAF4130324.1 unnamed protein product [Didymodactylos carnosus]